LLGHQPLDQGDGAVFVVGRWQSQVVHPPSIGLTIMAQQTLSGAGVPCLLTAEFSS
jgi:hypothetical protein